MENSVKFQSLTVDLGSAQMFVCPKFSRLHFTIASRTKISPLPQLNVRASNLTKTSTYWAAGRVRWHIVGGGGLEMSDREKINFTKIGNLFEVSWSNFTQKGYWDCYSPQATQVQLWHKIKNSQAHLRWGVFFLSSGLHSTLRCLCISRSNHSTGIVWSPIAGTFLYCYFQLGTHAFACLHEMLRICLGHGFRHFLKYCGFIGEGVTCQRLFGVCSIGSEILRIHTYDKGQCISWARHESVNPGYSSLQLKSPYEAA